MTSGPPSDIHSDIPEWVNPEPLGATRHGAEDGAALGAAPDVWSDGGSHDAGMHDDGMHDDGMHDDGMHDGGMYDEGMHDLDEGETLEMAFRSRDRAHWGRRLLVIAGLLLVGAVAVAGAVLVWVNGHLGGAGGTPVQLTIVDQEGHGALAAQLSHAHVVGDPWLFRRYLDYRGTSPARGGTYTFHLHEGYRAALHDLGKGPANTEVKLTIPEGYDLKQIAAAVGQLPGLSADRFLTLATSGAVRSSYQPAGSTTLEGLLFPDTYFISPQDDEQVILQRMVDRFSQIADATGLANSAQTNGLTPYQTIVLASLIEKEAKVDADRGKIAQVILNRLSKGMKLQIDATVEYAEGVHKTRLLNSDLATKSPYNTYVVAGLPPGPIGGPGRASLMAALNPTPGPWLYYVLSDSNGQHAFATTAKEFERLKAAAHAKGLL